MALSMITQQSNKSKSVNSVKQAVGQLNIFDEANRDIKDQRIRLIAEIILSNLKTNGWDNIFFIGNLPDSLYTNLRHLPFTFSVTGISEDDEQIENVVPYYSNVIIFNCHNFEEFEDAVRKIITLPYWHALGNIILYYHVPYEKDEVAKIFFSFWFYRAINVIIVQYNNTLEEILISQFSPYMSEDYKLDNLFGCWTARKIGMPIENFNDSFVCVRECHNVSLHSKLRANFLGTCIGFNTETVLLSNSSNIKNMTLFEDKAKDLHGFIFLAYIVETMPFLEIKIHENGTYTLLHRDGMIWNTMAELFNFKIDLFPSKETMKKDFDFEINTQNVFSFTFRKADLILFPLYQFDLVVAEIDYTVPFADSGVCVLSHRADYETIIFNEKLILRNILVVNEFFACFLCTCSQASIISLFSVHKRGKEVDTFEDIIKKDYVIEGMASPDVVLPDDEEKFRIFTSRIRVVHNFLECVNNMANDSRRFCLIDCAVGRYLTRNLLNRKGEQFLHVATDARVHSHYLMMILHKHSPLTERYNRYMMALFEAGIIRKWMDYRVCKYNISGPRHLIMMAAAGRGAPARDTLGACRCDVS
ncbi:unnamed protein product, partial [Brenthis ino]